jgi:signal transduction histidine kinase
MEVLNNMMDVNIIAIGCLNIVESELKGEVDYAHFNNFRAIKKQFRNNKVALIIACISNEEEEQLCEQVTQYVREGLLNQDVRIVILYHLPYVIDELNWLGRLQVNACLQVIEGKKPFNLTILKREVDTFLHIENNRRQHEAETEMLMCISRFSRDNESIIDLLKIFSASLSALCYSTCCFHIKIQTNNQGIIDYCDVDNDNLLVNLKTLFKLPQIPHFLQHTLDEKQPQISLLPEDIDLNSLNSDITEKIGSYLTFPIVAYNKPLYLLIYLITEKHMDKVTMRQINIINKAAEQLTMLLERRQAENSLKKQYKRLKTTLIDLKTTKRELQHKEKMASIGQMAAGIAHEINNPLAYVMSNFSCMDDYLKSIMQLQELQSEFLASIDIEENNKITELKRNISEFEKKEDIAFILQDIRAVILDSHNGLKRVKNIITDLSSFTYSQSVESEVCNLPQIIDDTLKMLPYDIVGSIQIKTALDVLPGFMTHNGLMQQVFTNLVKNAAQALISAKTSSPEILIKAYCQASDVVILVKDNGPGIPEEKLGNVFDPFYTTKPVGEGTGLGLSVTFNIIKKLGGTISVDSKKNTYTAFEIIFPVSA